VKVAIVGGGGRAGLPLALSLAAVGHKVVIIDKDEDRVNKINKRIMPFYEKDAEKALERLTIILQPMILVFMAFIIGFIMVALLLPLTDVSIWLGE
jgi:nucleoside-diphosphate-sugar epimerase